MRRSKSSHSEVNSRLEDSKRRIRRDLEDILREVEHTPLQKIAKKRTLRDLSLALEAVRAIRGLEAPREPEEPKEKAKRPKSTVTKMKKAGRSND